MQFETQTDARSHQQLACCIRAMVLYLHLHGLCDGYLGSSGSGDLPTRHQVARNTLSSAIVPPTGFTTDLAVIVHLGLASLNY